MTIESSTAILKKIKLSYTPEEQGKNIVLKCPECAQEMYTITLVPCVNYLTTCQHCKATFLVDLIATKLELPKFFMYAGEVYYWCNNILSVYIIDPQNYDSLYITESLRDPNKITVPHIKPLSPKRAAEVINQEILARMSWEIKKPEPNKETLTNLSKMLVTKWGEFGSNEFGANE